MDINELSILKPESLAADNIASIPVFQHIVENFSCDIHLNYNCNFPDCPDEVFRQAISLAKTSGRHYRTLMLYGHNQYIASETMEIPLILKQDL